MSELNEYSALHNGALFFDRSDRQRIRISGPKAGELLTGMVTNDVSALVPGEGQYAAALTPKGKIVADLRIFALEDAFLIDTSAAAAPGWKEMVRKYINPRIAPYHDVTSELADFGVSIPKDSRNVPTASSSAAASSSDSAFVSANSFRMSGRSVSRKR